MNATQGTIINLFIYIALVTLGILLGGRHLWGERVACWLGRLQLVSLLALILALGIRLGADEQVVASLGEIGLSALMIAVFSMLGSLAAVTLLRRYVLHLDRYGRYGKSDAECASESGAEGKAGTGLTGWIVLTVAAGMGLGYFAFSGRSTAWCGTVIDVGLYILLFLVGVDMGRHGNVLQEIRAAGFKALLIPCAVVIGTFLFSAGAVLALCIGDCLPCQCAQGDLFDCCDPFRRKDRRISGMCSPAGGRGHGYRPSRCCGGNAREDHDLCLCLRPDPVSPGSRSDPDPDYALIHRRQVFRAAVLCFDK